MVVEETITLPAGVRATRLIPRQRTESSPLDHAVRYAQERAWDVFPGTWLEADAGVPRCSCGASGCTAPGAHPARRDWSGEVTGSATTARRLWAERPRAAVLLPTGRAFDALEVPQMAGCLALARLERTARTAPTGSAATATAAPGPVTCTPDGRMVFFVLPGTAPRLADAVRKLGHSPGALPLTVRGEGDWVAAPPTRLGTRGSVQWARQPTAANRWLPDATELLPALVYACYATGATAPAG